VSDDTDAFWEDHPLVKAIIAPAISALLIGGASAYLGAQTAMARYDERISTLQTRTRKMRTRIENHDQRIRELQSLVDGRLTRLETKIDLLLDNKIDLQDKGQSGG